ncbi:ABC transporter permease [Paenibacillus eucommiae]|uniref:Aldouronate transport system permease protein n=1 Tax=Paenibacillus eucommiae TaxID=1355755 RepID=A0ABS4J333_9BACL|nr:ABC transporter permease subunit [Paenibacillus eucommiae]MBP1994249.1 putative aldouronate transport system permease protein [Paenibacillus eucommiae]
MEKRSNWHYMRKDKFLLLMMVPMVVLLFVFSYMPIYGILIAFQDYKIGMPFLSFDGTTKWVGFKHFIRFFDSVFFDRVMRNTLLISLYTIVFGFWIPIVFALLLNEIRRTFYKKVVQTLSYLPYFISSVVIVGIVLSLLSPVDGVINNIIEFFGGDRTAFMNDPQYFKTIYIITGIWQSFGWGSVLYLANIAAINQELYEAARMDGANRWRQMMHITLPGIMPTVTIMLIFAVGGLLNADVEKILLMYSPAVYDSADVIGTYTVREGVFNGNYSYAAAVGLFVSVINFIALILANTISRKVSDYGLW